MVRGGADHSLPKWTDYPLPSSWLRTRSVRHATLATLLGAPELSEAFSYVVSTEKRMLRNHEMIYFVIQ